MAVTATTRVVEEAGNGVKVAFDFAFKIFTESDLIVRKKAADGTYGDVLTLNTDYTVDFDTDAEQGTVTYTVAPVGSGGGSYIEREVDLTQESNFPIEDIVPAKTQENAFDKLTLAVQDLYAKIRRAPLQPTAPSDFDELSIEAPVANRILAWSDDGTEIVNTDTTLEEFDDDVTDTAAAAVAAAASASAASSSQSAAASSATAAASSASSASTSASSAASSASAASTSATAAASSASAASTSASSAASSASAASSSASSASTSASAAASSASSASTSATAAASSASSAATSATAAATSATNAATSETNAAASAAAAAVTAAGSSGTLAARPAAPSSITYYYATDIDQTFVYVPQASKWYLIG